jgi:hypothetical protein
MIVFRYKCSNSKCDYSYLSKPGGLAIYSENGEKKIASPDNSHEIADTISELLKVTKNEAEAWAGITDEKLPPEVKNKIDSNTGLLHLFVCTNCFTENFLNENKDKLVCSKCNSEKLVSPFLTCPKCKNGKLVKEDNIKKTADSIELNWQKSVNLKLTIIILLLIALFVLSIMKYVFI